MKLQVVLISFELIVFTLTPGALFLAEKTFAGEVEFNRDVRPILSEKCFACHGPDEKTREAELRLDQRESTLFEREGHAVISPENPSESELIARILSTDENQRMPPADSGPPLTEEEVSILKKWIEQGAKWQDHWAYIPPKRPMVPKYAGESLSPIDALIQRKQLEAGVSMNSPADRRTLIRRLTFDLTGLPPSIEEVEAFQRDQSSNAYEKLVDRLLDSPRYGERMAVYWLDLVRYADTLGFHGDQVRSVSPYRDYVIDAFNENKSFREFTIEQLAGDLFPNATLEQKVASTYNRINRASAEGGLQPKEYLAKYAADRVRTAGSVWLGSTIGCSECHDHKFDPFSTKDFYSFAAFFADIKEQGIVSGAKYIEQMPVPTPEQKSRQQSLLSKIDALTSQYEKDSPELNTAFELWQVEAQKAADRWQMHKPVSARSTTDATLRIDETGAVTASGKNPAKAVYELEFTAGLSAVGALRLEALTDETLPAEGPGRAANGNFVVQDVIVEVDGKKLEWASANASFDQAGYPASNLIDGKKKGWAIMPKMGESHQLILDAKEAIRIDGSTKNDSAQRIKISIVQNHGTNHTLGRFRISFSEHSVHEVDSIIPPLSALKILKRPSEERTQDEIAILGELFREQTPLLKPIREKLETLRRQQKQLENSIVTTLVTVSTTPREMRVLPRGDWMNNTGQVVLPEFPEFLSPNSSESDQERKNRLDLANWLTSPDNPLVARTFVNRLWMLLFGEGLSRSVDDLGSQGEWPTHPDLLDWLAVEFMDSGWDVKHVVKLIVMSETYRQSSTANPGLLKSDPYNKLYARQKSRRLDAEMIRDNALAVSGLLVETIGGVSAKPYQPQGYWGQLNFPKRTYQHDQDENQYRRGLYTHWQRTFLHPSLLAFDAPAREECTARRETSNTPLQALVLLNDPTYIESARVFAQKICQDPESSFDDRLKAAFRRCLARNPSQQEREVLNELYQQELGQFTENEDHADQFLRIGIAVAPETVNKSELAAWTSVARVLLNLHETITRY